MKQNVQAQASNTNFWRVSPFDIALVKKNLGTVMVSYLSGIVIHSVWLVDTRWGAGGGGGGI